MKHIFTLLTTLLLAPLAALTAAEKKNDKPNVLFILVDDLGVNDLALYGSKFFETPNINLLAKRGMKFTQAYSASPLCSPTRSSILTGLYPARTGITAPHCHLPEEVLEKKLAASAPPTQKALAAVSVTRLATNYFTLAEAFKADGYATAHFGKWHLGPEPYSPLQQGFDVDIPHTSAPSPLPNGFFYPFPVWKNHGKPGDNLEDLLADEAVKFIEQNKERPFFLNYWAFEVHSPWQAKEEQINKYRAKADPKALQRNPVYAGMVETLDEVVGRLVAALDKAGVLERTIIVFTSDNGPFFVPNAGHMPPEFRTVPVTSAQPLRAGKGTIYEAGTRVPLLVVWPGTVQPGIETSARVQSTDFFPTFADLLGWKLPTDVRFDGVSLRSVFESNTPVRDEIFCHFPHAQVADKYESMPAQTPISPASSVRQGDWKLIRLYCDNADRTDRYELYNLADDPGERQNLAAAQPARVTQLVTRLNQLLEGTAAVVPKPNPAFTLTTPKWKPRPIGVTFVQTPDGARLTSLVRDPGLSIDLSVNGVAAVEIIMKSNGADQGEIFWRSMFDNGTSLLSKKFSVKHDSQWYTYRVDLPKVDDLKMLRIDPSVEAGEQTIRSIRLLGADGESVKEWIYAESASGDVSHTADLLPLYAFGGGSYNGTTVPRAPVFTSNGGNLTLTAIVRTNDPASP